MSTTSILTTGSAAPHYSQTQIKGLRRQFVVFYATATEECFIPDTRDTAIPVELSIIIVITLILIWTVSP